jgi:hypothetical protein
MTMAKLSMTIKCTLSAIRYDGHCSPPVQYKAHRPMQHVHGYYGSNWTPPLGNYSLHIAPAATRATGKQTTINNYTYKAGRNRSHCLMEEVQGFTRSHWMLPLGKYNVK